MYSALEGDHIFRVEERSHPFFRDGLLKFCIGFIVARKQVLPHDGSAGGVDDLKRPIGFVFEPNNRDLSTATPSFSTVRDRPEWTRFGSRGFIVASISGKVPG